MRFHPGGPSIPDILLERRDAGRVVFLCGAGVSVRSGMPTFVELTKYVIDQLSPPSDSEIMAAFSPWQINPSAANIPLDQIFNLLHLEYGKDAVNTLITECLSVTQANGDVGREHALLKRISSNQRGVPQIVTTNFDHLFELGHEGNNLARHVPPAFPNIKFGSKIDGITYLHGRLWDTNSENHPYVLSSADFGRAYLSEGWATNFIKHLLEQYIVVLVGYRAEDPPVKYLLQGLNHDGQYDRSRLYAFDRGLPEEIEAKWRDRGVTAIAYSDHPVLWASMEAWAERADNPRRWRDSIIAKSQQDPKIMEPYERGQVAHVLRTAQGARLFSEAAPLPHPEWVCVMDANIRLAKQKRTYSNDEEFDPGVVYGLDDDLRNISDDGLQHRINSDNLLVWRNEDDNPPDYHRLAGVFETVPKRLGHLISWFSKSLDSPVMAWWAIRRDGLHPLLLQHLEHKIGVSTSLHHRARHLWSLILEHHKDPRNRRYTNDWYDLKARINTEGWTTGVLREFRRVTTPRLEIKPPYGLGEVRPPGGSWEDIAYSELGQYEVVFAERHGEDLDVPDNILPQVFGILEAQLIVASGLLKDIETSYFSTPGCYLDRNVEGKAFFNKSAEIFIWVVQLFDRIASKWPELANAYATIWPATEQYYFRKLKLYAFNKKNVFKAECAAKEVLALEHDGFWDTSVSRELLFLLVDRWEEFSQSARNQITERILTGPCQLSHYSDEEFSVRRDELAAIYGRYLELHGCELATVYSERLSEIINGIPGWNDNWTNSLVTSRGSYTQRVDTDENPDTLLKLPVNQVIAKSREDSKRDFGSITVKRPFLGLVKVNPRKALSALTVAAKAGEYPNEYWSFMINDLPTNVTPRLKRVFLNRIARLPNAVIVELRHKLSYWLEQEFVSIIKFDDGLGWVVYDHVVEGILSGGADVTESPLRDIRQTGEVILPSRRTFGHALNGPVGRCVLALIQTVLDDGQEAGSLIPDEIKSRIEYILNAPGEGTDHVVAILTKHLNWLMFVDPVWTKEYLIPMLAFEHPASEPAWNGFLHENNCPSAPVVRLVKPLLLKLIPWLKTFSWGKDLSIDAAQWLGYMRMFYNDEQSGLCREEMRTVLRFMSDETRNRFISWLSFVGQKEESGWSKYVIPLISEDWPRERLYRTLASAKAWIDLLDKTGDSFPAVYATVKMFLVPLDTDHCPLYQFTRESGAKKPLTVVFPETTLDLMDTITSQRLTHPPYELRKILAIIAEVEPNLISDQRYLRLIDLVERS